MIFWTMAQGAGPVMPLVYPFGFFQPLAPSDFLRSEDSSRAQLSRPAPHDGRPLHVAGLPRRRRNGKPL